MVTSALTSFKTCGPQLMIAERLLSIQSLLGELNVESPLNNYAASLWRNQEDYKNVVHKHYMHGGAGLES